MKIIDDSALLFTVPDKIAHLIKELDRCEILSSSGGMSEVLVYWDYEEAKQIADVLDQFQPDATLPNVPSTIIRDYNFAGVYKPFEHQIYTASFLSLRSRAFCFNEAGTGKTSAAIWAADYLMELGLVSRVLIICPMSIMQSAWQADIFKTAMHRTVGVAHGDKDKRLKILKAGYDFVVINYDGVGVVLDDLAKIGFDLIIVDEANAYKTSTTKRWRQLNKLATPDTRLWMMTGTPASQSAEDAYGLAKLVSPWRVPRHLTQWRDKVQYRVAKFQYAEKPTARKDVFDALQPAIRYTKAECLDLPDVTYQTREVPLTPQVLHYYNRLKKEMLIETAGREISAVNAAASLTKLLQISGGAVYADGGDVIEFDVSPRLKALKEVLEETSHKTIIFVPYLHTIEVITKYLDSHNISCEVINGSVGLNRRTEIFRAFQTMSDPKVLVIQPAAASHGVTLTAADTIVFWSPVMSVETYIQCIGRIDRVGQQNKMTVVHLQGSDVERRVYKMLDGKVDSHLKLVDLYKQEVEG